MNKEQFRYIFDTYFDSIRSFVYYRTSSEETADDIAQDVFMQFWEHRERFELSHVKALLYKMASDSVVSHYRRQDIRLDFSRNIRLDETTISPEEQLQFEELSQKYAIINAAFQQGNAYGQQKGQNAHGGNTNAQKSNRGQSYKGGAKSASTCTGTDNEGGVGKRYRGGK